MKSKYLEGLTPLERRQFIKLIGGILALPMVSHSTRDAMVEMLLGPQANAQTLLPTNFIEINFRDQWDFGSLFVPPSVAKNYSSIQNQIALFDPPIAERNGFWITPQAVELRPHLDDIAVMELGECTLPDGQTTHGHEAGNPLRSPGRSKTAGAGRFDMASVDKRPGVDGNEILYSSTPTPLILHNYYNRMLKPDLTNGVIMRSSIKSYEHTYYHFEAGLTNAQVDRYFDSATLLRVFDVVGTTGTPSTLQKFSSLITKMLKSVDDQYLVRAVADSNLRTQHTADLNSLATSLNSTNLAQPSIALTTAEKAYWTQGVIGVLNCPGQDANGCYTVTNRWHPGELFGYAAKLLSAGRVRSVGIDFDMEDVHTNRTPFVMTSMAQQSGSTLARLISSLKSAGIWDRTCIAIFTLDGSRSPLLSSTGDRTKNAVILAGGMIKGGYYGDVKVSSTGSVTYHRPDDTGVAVTTGTTGGSGRVPAADVYKTVATAAGIPATLQNSFADVMPGKVLSYMLK